MSLNPPGVYGDPQIYETVRKEVTMGFPSGKVYREKVFYADSVNGNAQNGGETPDTPTATLAQALALATAARGDRIVLAPNHAETITGVGGLALAKADIEIIGLGWGTAKPRFLMDGGTTVDAAVSAANVRIRNVAFAAGHADIVRCFNVTAKGFQLVDVDFTENVAAENFLTPVKATSTTDNNADGLRVAGCRFIGADAGALEFIEINANLNDLQVIGNFVSHLGTASPLILGAGTKVFTGALIMSNFLSHRMTANPLFVNAGGTTHRGIIAHNRVRHADVTTTHDLGIDGMGYGLFDNLSVSTDSLSGLLLPVADVNS